MCVEHGDDGHGASALRVTQAADLVNRGANPAAKDKHGRQAAHYAASHGHAPLLEYLASLGVDLEVDDPMGRSPLHHAAAGEGARGEGGAAKAGVRGLVSRTARVGPHGAALR